MDLYFPAGTIVRDLTGKSVLGAGFRPLLHAAFPSQNLYRDDAVGLNFEHIMNGTAADRDSGYRTRLALTWSDDGGESWSPFVSTTFQNTYSRAYAGRLSDGRFYIMGNNFDQYLNRVHMHMALSDDGERFDRMYTLVEGPTTRRVPGRHKEDGYHYPNCMVDGDKLLTVYSVNKEDIEVSVVDTTTFR